MRPVIRAGLGRLMLGVSAFELGNVAATLLILRATELLAPTRGGDPATSVALILYICYNAAATLASVPAGHASDRTTPRLVLSGGVVAFLVAYTIFALIGPSVPVLLLAFVLSGIGIGCVETAEHAAVAAAAPADIRGSAFGLLASVQSLGNLAASAITGIIWTVASPTAAFLPRHMDAHRWDTAQSATQNVTSWIAWRSGGRLRLTFEIEAARALTG